jgi:hypothetical protein
MLGYARAGNEQFPRRLTGVRTTVEEMLTSSMLIYPKRQLGYNKAINGSPKE